MSALSTRDTTAVSRTTIKAHCARRSWVRDQRVASFEATDVASRNQGQNKPRTCCNHNTVFIQTRSCCCTRSSPPIHSILLERGQRNTRQLTPRLGSVQLIAAWAKEVPQILTCPIHYSSPIQYLSILEGSRHRQSAEVIQDALETTTRF